MKKSEEKKLIEELDTAALTLLETLGADRGETPMARAQDLPVGTRQILIVKSYSMYSSNWLVSASNPKIGSQPNILLAGHPSPSSQVEKGYVRFVDQSELRRPTYSAKDKRIDIYLDYRAMPQVLRQLEHKNRFLWVGHFKGGHIYGDLHSGD